jgi:glutamine synthetase adenylyltransferase
MGFAMLEDYLVAQGRPWERYAWIKARPLTGTRHDELMQIVRPFVFRKYLDFDAFAAIRDLHVQIRREVARRDMQHNVKLGPGGIREIEFTAQVFQLIRGGQIAALRQRPTLTVLAELEKNGLLTADAQQELAAAYDFLRRLEHRLQYLDDAQTQLLPDDAESQAWVEASNYDLKLAGRISSAHTLGADGSFIPLIYKGQGYQLQNQAVQLQFQIAATGTESGLAIDQGVQVFVRTREQVRGVAVPPQAIARRNNAENVVWVRHAAEVFTPHVVRIVGFDEKNQYPVITGIAPGDRVVSTDQLVLTQAR